jgi:hypothetical protein
MDYKGLHTKMSVVFQRLDTKMSVVLYQIVCGQKGSFTASFESRAYQNERGFCQAAVSAPGG